MLIKTNTGILEVQQMHDIHTSTSIAKKKLFETHVKLRVR